VGKVAVTSGGGGMCHVLGLVPGPKGGVGGGGGVGVGGEGVWGGCVGVGSEHVVGYLINMRLSCHEKHSIILCVSQKAFYYSMRACSRLFRSMHICCVCVMRAWHIHTEGPCLHSKEPCIHSKEVYIHTEVPDTLSKEPELH